MFSAFPVGVGRRLGPAWAAPASRPGLRARSRGQRFAADEYATTPAHPLREPNTHDDLYTPISDEELEETPFHAVKLASQSEMHALVTEELATWFVEQLP